MKKVFIVGGNGFARECYQNLVYIMEKENDIIFGGFLGHGGYGHTVDYKNLQIYYKGEVSEHIFKDDEYVIVGAGFPELRVKIYKELKKRNLKFFNLIGRDVLIGTGTEIGEANIVVGKTTISVQSKFGIGNVFNGEVNIGHDCEIGDFNFFGPRSQVLGNAKIGNMNTIGANAILLPHAKIGDNNKIAPLSAVYKGCKNNCYMSGNPAMKIGSTDND